MKKVAISQESLARILREKVASIPGIEEKPLQLSHDVVPRAYWAAGMEFLHFHGDHQIDLRVLDDAMRAEFLRDPRAKVNPYARSRVEFDFFTPEDAVDALRMIRRVCLYLTETRGPTQTRVHHPPRIARRT